MIKKIIAFLLMGIACFFAIQNYQHPQLKFNHGLDRLTHPFDTRVRYRIGQVDNRFGLTETQVIDLSEKAANIWRDGTGKEWFVYDKDARLTINFIYDERQAESDARRDTKFAIDGMVMSHQKQSAKIDSDKRSLDIEFNAIQNQVNHWQSSYNELVSHINSTQDPTIRQNLLNEHQAMLAQKQVLDSKVLAYNQKRASFNEFVDEFNQHTQTINTAINNANRRFVARQFHKGIFNGKEINIYEFSSLDDLKLTLAHELGHALDIGHNDDPSALMYSMAGEQDMANFKLKPADIELLNHRGEHDRLF